CERLTVDFHVSGNLDGRAVVRTGAPHPPVGDERAEECPAACNGTVVVDGEGGVRDTLGDGAVLARPGRLGPARRVQRKGPERRGDDDDGCDGFRHVSLSWPATSVVCRAPAP